MSPACTSCWDREQDISCPLLRKFIQVNPFVVNYLLHFSVKLIDFNYRKTRLYNQMYLVLDNSF